MIFASAAAFSFVHIVYYSPFSMITTFFLGLYLGYIYEKTKSVLFTAILHGYLGNVVFTVGLGHHFWQDMEKYL
jgi:membrane protease YdiL (CAAX protease family)